MKKTVLSVIVGTALAGAISVANAEQPMTLSADQMDRVTAGGFAFVDAQLVITKFKDIQEFVFYDVDKTADVFVNITGYWADAEAGANCMAVDCVSETLTITDVRADMFTSTAYSQSFSAGDIVP